MNNIEFSILHYLLITLFTLGYLAIIFEPMLKLNKAASALLMATGSWPLFLGYFHISKEKLEQLLKEYLSPASYMVFFLLGALVLVELIDAHKGFRVITDRCNNIGSKRKILWLVGLLTFFLSSFLDNLTITIIMLALLRKLIPEANERKLFGALVVIAANAGGIWSPIGDITKTMLSKEGTITFFPVNHNLFLPSFISFLVSLLLFSLYFKKNNLHLCNKIKKDSVEPGAKTIFYLGMIPLAFLPALKIGLSFPPFMTLLLAVGMLWLTTDLMHSNHKGRNHLKITSILSKIDVTVVLFFLGILLAISSLEITGILTRLIQSINQHVVTPTGKSIVIGLFSSVFNNIPIVTAISKIYHGLPPNSLLWQMIAYCTGTGGSILIVGSISGIAFMGIEKVDFLWYLKKVTPIALLSYFSGILFYTLWVL